MTQTAKVEEPSMEEILASIRRIITDDENKANATEPARPMSTASPRPVAPPSRPVAVAMNQDDIDTMLSGLEAPPGKPNGGSMKDSRASVFDLTESMTAPAAPQPPVFRTIEGQSDVFFSEDNAGSAPAGSMSGAVEEARHQFTQGSAERPLLSPSTTAAVDSAFNTLANTVLVQNALTLEDLVREMMRPMLKSWLDDNLPSMVERIVRAEIERVSRGRQG